MLVGQIIKCGLTCEGVDSPQILLRILVQEGKRNRLTYKLSIFSVVRSLKIRLLFFIVSEAGVMCRGDRGDGAPLVKISAHFGGLSPPKTLALAWLFRVYWSYFQSAIIKCALLYGY